MEHLYISFCRCEIIEETVKTPVCVTVTDQEVEEVCEFVTPEPRPPPPTPPPQTCYERDCQPTNTTRLVKECRPVVTQQCDAEIETVDEEECRDVTTTHIEEVCSDKVEESCRQDFEYVCQETVTEAPLNDYGYEAKILPPVRQSRYGQRLGEGPGDWRRKRKRRDANYNVDPWPRHPGIDNPFSSLTGKGQQQTINCSMVAVLYGNNSRVTSRELETDPDLPMKQYITFPFSTMAK